jgi:hypothetical protein
MKKTIAILVLGIVAGAVALGQQQYQTVPESFTILPGGKIQGIGARRIAIGVPPRLTPPIRWSPMLTRPLPPSQQSKLIPLCDGLTTSNTTGSNGVVPRPLGVKIAGISDLIGVVKVTSAPSGGGPGQNVLNVGFQSSCDNGQTWNSFIGVQATSTGTWYVPFSTIAVPLFNVNAYLTGQFTLLGSAQGPIGNQIRMNYGAFVLSGATGAWTFQVFILPRNISRTPEVVEVTPLMDSSSTGGAFTVNNPQGIKVKPLKNLVCVLRNPTVPTGGTPTLDVIFQASADDGQTWTDIAHPQVTTTVQDQYFNLPLLAPGPTSVTAVQDGTSGVNAFNLGPIGDRIRVKYKTVPGGSTGSYTFQCYALVD